MWHICIFLERKNHSSHYLLTFVKKSNITPLLTVPTRSHPHPQTEPWLISPWLPILYHWPIILSKLSYPTVYYTFALGCSTSTFNSTDTKLNASTAPQTQCAPTLFTPPITQSICHLANLSNAGLLPLHTVHIPPPHSSSPSLLHCPNLGLHQFSAAATCYFISLPHAPPYDLFPAPCSQNPETLLPTEDPTMAWWEPSQGPGKSQTYPLTW